MVRHQKKDKQTSKKICDPSVGLLALGWVDPGTVTTLPSSDHNVNGGIEICST